MSGDSGLLLARWRQGDELAADELHARYTARLVSLLRSRISPKLRRRTDPDDILQSMYRSFFVRARNGEFEVVQPGDLWRLLATIALRKLARHAERHSAVKRSVRRETSQLPTDKGPVSRDPSPAEVIAASEELNWLLRQLEPNQRSAIELLLQDKTIAEAASELGRTPRTVQRWLKDAKQLFEERLTGADAAPVPSPAAHRIKSDITSGQSIDDYRIVRLIGSGGICKVYAARDKRYGQMRCLKVLRKRHQRNPQLVGRFIREAQLVAGLNHSGIVQVHGFGQLPAGGYFMVMDLVQGKNFYDIRQHRRFTADEAAGVVKQVAIAVHYAHRRGVIHCDLKPQNVLQSEDGHVAVTDFGFAELVTNGEPGAETTAYVAGTWGYLAPERFRCDCEIGPATDVYGLGALLFFLINGEPPMKTVCSSSTIWTLQHQGQSQPAQWKEAAPQELRDICDRCLQIRPADRHASALQVADALSGYLQQE